MHFVAAALRALDAVSTALPVGASVSTSVAFIFPYGGLRSVLQLLVVVITLAILRVTLIPRVSLLFGLVPVHVVVAVTLVPKDNRASLGALIRLRSAGGLGAALVEVVGMGVAHVVTGGGVALLSTDVLGGGLATDGALLGSCLAGPNVDGLLIELVHVVNDGLASTTSERPRLRIKPSVLLAVHGVPRTVLLEDTPLADVLELHL